MIYNDLEDVTICKKLTNKTTGSPVTDVISFSINVVSCSGTMKIAWTRYKSSRPSAGLLKNFLCYFAHYQKNVVEGVAHWLLNDS